MTLCLCVIVGRHCRGVVLTRIRSLAFPHMRYLDLLCFRSHLPFANSPPSLIHTLFGATPTHRYCLLTPLRLYHNLGLTLRSLLLLLPYHPYPALPCVCRYGYYYRPLPSYLAISSIICSLRDRVSPYVY